MMNFAALAGKRWHAIITTVEKLSDLLVTRHQSLCLSLGSSSMRGPQRFAMISRAREAGMKKCFVVARLGKADHPQNRDAMGGIKCNAIGSRTVNDQHPEQNIQTKKRVYDEKYYAMA